MKQSSTRKRTTTTPRGRVNESVKAVIAPALDPNFFSALGGSQLSSEDIEHKPYAYHWMTYACARTIVRNVSRIKFNIVDPTKGEEVFPAGVKIPVLQNPNPFMTRTQFWEHVFLNYMLPAKSTGAIGSEQKGGQCFIVCKGKDINKKLDLTRGDIPDTMWPYSEDYFEKVVEHGKFKGWNFRINPTDTPIFYLPNEIIRIVATNPYDWLKGLPVMSPVQVALLQDLNAEVWNTRNFTNDAVPAGILSSDQMLTDPVAKEMQARWYQKYGSGNQRKIAVLGAGLKFQQLAFNAKDMEFIRQKDAIRKSFLAAWGLNEIALGNYEQVNYATIVEGRRMLWEDTYLPIVESVCEQFTAQWIRFIDAPRTLWELVPDMAKIPAMQRAMDGASQVAQRFFQMGAPFTLACQLAEIALPKGTAEQYPWLDQQPDPKGLGGLMGAPAAEEPEKEDEEDDDEEEKPATAKSIVRVSRDRLDAYSLQYIARVLDPGERYLIDKLERFFHAQAVTMMDNVDHWAKQSGADNTIKAVINRSVPVIGMSDLLPSEANEVEKLVKIYRMFADDQLRRERAKLTEELGAAAINWNVKDPLIDRYVARRKADLREINNLTFKKVEDRVTDAIKEAIDKNETVGQLSLTIKEMIRDVEQIRKNQSRTIARTETGIVSSTARYDTFKAADIQWHQWVNAADENVRINHQNEPVGDGGSVVRVGNLFAHTGLHHPQESTGDPSEIINCRCVALAVSDSEGTEYGAD